MAFTYEGLDHVQLAAPEGCEEEARRFFNGVLGWPEMEKPAPLRRRGGVWFRCGLHAVHIGIEEPFAPARKAHPAFAVRGIDALRIHLEERGIPTREDVPLDGVKRFFVDDPFGNRLEFTESL